MNLKFVELTDVDRREVVLEKKQSQIIGRDGDIKPQITDGHLSRQHARVVFTGNDTWDIHDGVSTESHNGLFFFPTGSEESIEVIQMVKMSNIGERIDLLNLPKNHVYLEVVREGDRIINNVKEKAKDQSKITAGIGLQIEALATSSEKVVTKIDQVDSNLEAIKVNHNATIKALAVNREEISNISRELKTALETAATVGKDPLPYLIGAGTIAVILAIGLVFFTLYKTVSQPNWPAPIAAPQSPK
jgi:hypothetical protein